LIEPEPALLRACLDRRDWTSMISSGRLMILAGPRFDGHTEAWRLVGADGLDPVVLGHPVLGDASLPVAREAARVAAQAVAGARANEQARQQFGGRYLLNTVRNLPRILCGPDAAVLDGRFAGMPAVLVAAGPSLDRNLAGLRAVADRALVISTDTAWRPLVSAGIDPPLVVAADPSELNGRHLVGVPSRAGTWLIAEGSVDPRALDAWAGRVAAFRVAEHHPWPWLLRHGVSRRLVRVWGSVLTAAFDLAVGFSCDPIVFVGADLAYTGDRPYCRGTAFEEDWAGHAARGVSLREIWRNTLAARPTLTVEGLDGREVSSATHFIEFRNWLVARTQDHPSRRFINATGAGTLHGPRLEQSDIESALSGQPVRAGELREELRRALAPDEGLPAARALLRAIDEMSAAASVEPGPGSTDDTPLREWVAFGAPSVTVADIRSALAHARRALRAGPAPVA
jgi:hypothetical protein